MVREAMSLRQEGLGLRRFQLKEGDGKTLPASAIMQALPPAYSISCVTPGPEGEAGQMNEEHSKACEHQDASQALPQCLARDELVSRLRVAEEKAAAMQVHLRTALEMLHKAREQQALVSAHLTRQTKMHEREVQDLTCEVAALRKATLPIALEKTRASKILDTRRTSSSDSRRIAACSACDKLRAKSASLAEELVVMQKSHTASETQLLRAVRKHRDELSRANKQILDQARLIEEQEVALKNYRKHESRLQKSLSKASSDELRRARKLELLEEAGAQLLRIFNSAEGIGPTCTLYSSSSEPDGPAAGADDESESGCERSESRAASEALNRRIDKLVALACTQLDMLTARA